VVVDDAGHSPDHPGIRQTSQRRRYNEAIRGKVSIRRYELINPRVRVVGGAAVLIFNYVSYGEPENAYRWNCTEVYRHTG
jgi:hypothetical protein